MTDQAIAGSRDFFSPVHQAKLRMIEQIMHLHGCSQPHPRQYRANLMGMTYEDVNRLYNQLMEGME